VAHLLQDVEPELVEFGAPSGSGFLEPNVETEGAVVEVTRNWFKLRKQEREGKQPLAPTQNGKQPMQQRKIKAGGMRRT
jgi:hypothetical protein